MNKLQTDRRISSRVPEAILSFFLSFFLLAKRFFDVLTNEVDRLSNIPRASAASVLPPKTRPRTPPGNSLRSSSPLMVYHSEMIKTKGISLDIIERVVIHLSADNRIYGCLQGAADQCAHAIDIRRNAGPPSASAQTADNI
jgi:hypothetical protein